MEKKPPVEAAFLNNDDLIIFATQSGCRTLCQTDGTSVRTHRASASYPYF
ncbi:MAG: hypothetical protein ACN6NU_08100 [Acinetobacter sp.]